MEGVKRTVRVTYSDKEDMGYIYLAEIALGEVERTEPLAIETAGGVRMINLDFDREGRLVGIEFEGARGSMPPGLMR